MKKIYNTILIAALALFSASCTKTFDEPGDFVPVNMEPTHSIAQLKAMRVSGSTEVLGNVIVSGKVVSSDAEGNFYRSFFIQDETGGVEIKVGDYVMVQMGIIVKKIPEKDAKVAIKAWSGS